VLDDTDGRVLGRASTDTGAPGSHSGGCWWHVTLAPVAGQSPEDLARGTGVSEEQSRPPTPLDPGFVYVGADPREDHLVVYVGCR
jgi:hypothetical protein